MKIRTEILEPDCFYHIFNRGINKQKIFLTNENYLYFLRQVKKYLISVVDIYAYCLMPNHFHLLLKIKPSKKLEKTTTKNINNSIGLHSFDKIISKQLGKLFSSYTQAFNKMNNRSGALLDSPFKRIKIDSEKYLINNIIYIHQNPIDFKKYKYSSYQSVLSKLPTNIMRNEIIEIFDDVNNYVFCHKKIIDFNRLFKINFQLCQSFKL